MSPRRHLPLLLALTAFLLLAGASVAAGDWLVLRDGSRIETDGPWELRGQLIVFRLPGGTLSSMRASEVDLEASEEATEAARRPPPPPEPPPRRQPVVVLTDGDVAQALLPAEIGEGELGDTEDEEGSRPITARAPGMPPRPDRLQVVDWRRGDGVAEGVDGAVINGTLLNNSAHAVGQVALTVHLYDVDGDLVETAVATLGAPGLRPTQRTPFRAAFPGVFTFQDVGFAVDYVALEYDPSSPDEEDEPSY